MCGQTAAFALLREGVRNMRCLDRAPRGGEGPWTTFARMDILRSPKHLTGPDLGVAALTYRAWHEAKFGVGALGEAAQDRPRRVGALPAVGARHGRQCRWRTAWSVRSIELAAGRRVASQRRRKPILRAQGRAGHGARRQRRAALAEVRDLRSGASAGTPCFTRPTTSISERLRQEHRRYSAPAPRPSTTPPRRSKRARRRW